MRSSFLAKYSLILSTSFFLRESNLRSLSKQPVGKGRIKIKVQDQRKFTSIQCGTQEGEANLRKISKVTYRLLDITQAPNSRMFPTTSEMSKIVFSWLWKPVWITWSRTALKTIYLFGCLRGSLVISKVLGGFFVSSETARYPDGSSRRIEGIEHAVLSSENSKGRFIFNRNFQVTFSFNKNHNIFVIKCENTTSENCR